MVAVNISESQPNFIGIVGPMSIGKSTLSKNLAQYLDGIDEPEPDVTKLQIFNDYYRCLKYKPNPFCYLFEMEYLARALEQAERIRERLKKNKRKTVVLDQALPGHMMYMVLNEENYNTTPEYFWKYHQKFLETVSETVHPQILLMVINENMDEVARRLIERAGLTPERAAEIQFLDGTLDLIERQNKYVKNLVETGVNYPAVLIELNRTLPQIPMILLDSDIMDWTTPEAAGEIYEQLIAPQYAILKAA